MQLLQQVIGIIKDLIKALSGTQPWRTLRIVQLDYSFVSCGADLS
jgi:hypothetical protein